MREWILAGALVLTGCGGGSTAELRLMDAPPEGVTAVKITVDSMQVHVAGDDEEEDGEAGWETLAVGKTIDLVQHQGESAAEVLGQLELPEGKITQIRLVIDTSAPGNNTATLNGTDCELDVSKVDVKGVKIIHPFKAFPSEAGGEIEVLVDFRLDESLKPAGSCFVLEPRLHLDKVKVDGETVEL